MMNCMSCSCLKICRGVPLKDLSDDLLVNLVLTALMSQSWKESSNSLICVSICVAVCSLYLSDAASTKEDSLSISLACLKASSSTLMYQFFFAIFLRSFSLVNCGNFLAYSMIAVLLNCSFGGSPNATWWIAWYLEFYVTSGSFSFICNPCSLAAASAVLGISEKFAKITSLISWSVAVAESSINTGSIDGAIPWQSNFLNNKSPQSGWARWCIWICLFRQKF